MDFDREKLKVIDIEFKRNNTNNQTLFFDVIEHKFEDQFLVIKYYKEYADETVRGLQTYIPKENIVQFIVYEEKADYEKYLDDLMGVNKIPNDKDLKLFRVPHRDVIQLTRLINGEEAGSWYEQER